MLRAIVIGLLLIHVGLLLGSLRQNFVAVDEVSHVSAGLSYWETGTFDASRVNPPLVKALAVLPVLAVWPGVTSQGLRTSPAVFDIVCLARLAGIAWSQVGCWVIYRWADELYGNWAACLGLALWCLGPNVLAHAQLMTPDVPAAVAGLAATYAFWHYLRQPSWALAYVAGLLLGIAQLTKFTLLVLYGAWLGLWLIRRLDSTRDPLPLWKQAAGEGLLIATISWAVVNAGYGFDGTGRLLGNYAFSSRFLTGGSQADGSAGAGPLKGNRFRDCWLGYLPVPLPADYVFGIDEQWARIEQRRASYLAGEWSREGWRYYYLHALAVKVPLGVMGVVLWGGMLTLRRCKSRACLVDELALLLPAVLTFAVISSQTGINRHLRYVLPVFPFVVISTSKVAVCLQTGLWRVRLVAAALLVWGCGSSLVVYPHALSYFNELAGGPDNGHAHLVDSNIDWGQDLLFLKEWLDKHPEARPLGLAYFNVIDPRVIGLEYTLPPPWPGSNLRLKGDAAGAGPQAGYFAVSVNYLRGLEFQAPNGQGGWEAVAREDYQYFREFAPIAKAGYSIYIYHITPDQANALRRKLGLPELRGPSHQPES